MRPRTLSGLYGQTAIVSAIRQHMAKRPPRTWLFYGESGSGKTTLARIIALAFQCSHMKLWGDPCEDCWKNFSNFPIHEINASEHSGVDELEKIAELSQHRPITGMKRIIILDECHGLSKQAWNAILTPMEEPPEFTVWILCTSEIRKVPVASIRRCTKYQLKTLGITDTENFLKKYAAKAEVTRALDPLIEAVHIMRVSAPGLLLQALEKYAAGATASDAAAGADGSSVDTFRLCRAVTSGNWKETCTLLKDTTPEDSRFLRACMAGWLKGILVKEPNPVGQARAAKCLLELCSPPYDDAMWVHWLHAELYQICSRYGARQ